MRPGRRTSPIDGGNLNRSFPGRPDGTVTEKIADYVQRHLLASQLVLNPVAVVMQTLLCLFQHCQPVAGGR